MDCNFSFKTTGSVFINTSIFRNTSVFIYTKGDMLTI